MELSRDFAQNHEGSAALLLDPWSKDPHDYQLHSGWIPERCCPSPSQDAGGGGEWNSLVCELDLTHDIADLSMLTGSAQTRSGPSHP